MSAYFCMGAYKCDVVIITKIGACIHGCLFCMGAYYPDLVVNVATCTCIAAVSHVKVYLSGECSVLICFPQMLLGQLIVSCTLDTEAGLLYAVQQWLSASTTSDLCTFYYRPYASELFLSRQNKRTKQSAMPQRIAYYHQWIPKLLNGVDPFVITSNYCLVGMHLLCTT